MLAEHDEELGANCGEKVDLTFLHGQQRCCAPLHEHTPLFNGMGTEALERQGRVVRPQRVMRNGTVGFSVQGKYGQEDVGAMHDQLKDDRHGEVFPSNAPFIEHEGSASGTCSQGPPRCA